MNIKLSDGNNLLKLKVNQNITVEELKKKF